MTSTQKNDVLVAVVPNVSDWVLISDELWYRIPVDSAPPIVRNNEIEYLAFYHNRKFNAELKSKIVHYAKVKSISRVLRGQLFPKESLHNPKSKNEYFKIEIEEISKLERPIVSRKEHRIVFVPTTKDKFFSESSDINKIFSNSFLEQKMTDIMLDMRIVFEREYCVRVNKIKNYHLDFAVFCNKGQSDVECDGDTYHMGYDNVVYDKTRNNELESDKWKVLRYTTKHFEETNHAHIRNTLYKCVTEFGGCLFEPEAPYFTSVDKKGQITLF